MDPIGDTRVYGCTGRQNKCRMFVTRARFNYATVWVLPSYAGEQAQFDALDAYAIVPLDALLDDRVSMNVMQRFATERSRKITISYYLNPTGYMMKNYVSAVEKLTWLLDNNIEIQQIHLYHLLIAGVVQWPVVLEHNPRGAQLELQRSFIQCMILYNVIRQPVDFVYHLQYFEKDAILLAVLFESEYRKARDAIDVLYGPPRAQLPFKWFYYLGSISKMGCIFDPHNNGWYHYQRFWLDWLEYICEDDRVELLNGVYLVESSDMFVDMAVLNWLPPMQSIERSSQSVKDTAVQWFAGVHPVQLERAAIRAAVSAWAPREMALLIGTFVIDDWVLKN